MLQVPLSMIALLDLINPKSKGKGTLSPDLKCRMASFPARSSLLLPPGQ